MDEIEKLVREFGNRSHAKIKNAAERLGIAIDQDFVHLRNSLFAVQWMTVVICLESDIEVIDIQHEIATKVKGPIPAATAISFCFNACRGGFDMIEDGDYANALAAFGIARSVVGFLLRNDYKKIFAVNGKKGGESRHASMNRVKEQILDIFNAGGNWKNPRQAAKQLADKAKKLAEEEGTRFTTDDVPARLYGWFLKSKNQKSIVPSS